MRIKSVFQTKLKTVQMLHVYL